MSKKKEKDLVERVKEFMKDNSDTFEINNDDFKVSKSVASGLGWSEKDRKIWGSDEGRAEVTVNILRPYVNKLISQYDSNPFGLGIKNIGPTMKDLTNLRMVMDYVLKSSDFNIITSEALKETVDDGLGYVLAYHQENSSGTFDIKLKKLDNRSVFFDNDCREANGSDAQMVVHADTISKAEAKETYEFTDTEFRQSDILQGFDVLDGNKKQCGLITVYEKTSEGVKISKIIHSRVVDETILPIDTIPIVRYYGEKVTLKNQVNWRGAYYFVADLCRSINFYASLQQERVACSPTTGYLVAQEGLTGKDTQFSKINGSPRGYLSYKAYTSDGLALPKPEKVQQEAQINDVTTSINGFQTLVAGILGDSGTNETIANETAESVLLRKSNNEASISLYIRNAKDSSIALGRIILKMTPMVFDVPRVINELDAEPVTDIKGLDVYVDNGPIAASQKEKNIRQLVAFGTMIANNPEAAKIAPVLIENLDIEPKAKQFLMQTYGQPSGQMNPQAMAALGAKDQQIAAMTTQLTEQGKTIAQLQAALFEYENDMKSKILIAQIDRQTKLELKQMDLSAEAQAQNKDLVAEAAARTEKLQAEIVKERIKNPEPIWEPTRFVPNKLS